MSTYTPFGLANVSTPIIAPFFGDVDTRNIASSIVSYGNGTVGGRTAFGANWDNQGVGYFPSAADKLNKFQLVLVDRSDLGTGDFDFEFNYEQIQWETGGASGGVNGLGGTPAAVGYSNGLTGTSNVSYEFPGSRVTRTFLDTGSAPLINDSLGSNVLGRYLFTVRNGQVILPPDPPGPLDPEDTSIPEPSSLLSLLALGLAGAATKLKRQLQ